MSIAPAPVPVTTPKPFILKPHQQQIHDFLATRPYGGSWLGIGSGKTLSTLAVLQSVRPIGHILVVAPIAIARSTWLNEIAEWGFPIRTKSLIADQNDKKLSKDRRLQAFAEVFTDPPTMYFISQELLTQPSQSKELLAAVPGAQGRAGAATVSQLARDVLGALLAAGPLDQAELIAIHRKEAAAAGGRQPSKASVVDGIRELIEQGLVVRERHDCRSCGGDGCRRCRFGLIDQLPVRDIDGRPTRIWPFPTVIIEESQGFKSHSSERFRALASVRPAMSRVIELTGTPSPNGLHDLWSQIYLLDQGEALGRTITEFRERWFTPQMVPGTTTAARWIPNLGAKEEIFDAIRHLVMSAENTTLSLPGGKPDVQQQTVVLPPDLLQAYKDFKRDLVLDVVKTYQDEKGRLVKTVESIIAESAAVLTSKLMQFASGTLYTSDPDDPSTKGRYTVLHDKKAQMAEYLVRNNGGEPMLIAYHFRSDLEQLLRRFAKAGIDARAFDGSRAMVHQWNAKQIPVMLLHPAAAGHGLNLQHGGASMIWYTLPFSLEHWMQTNGRLFRTGQTKPVTIHTLVTQGTQDERMPAVLATKEAVQAELIDAVSAEEIELAALEKEIHDDLNALWVSDRA